MSKDWEKEYSAKSLNDTPLPASLLENHINLLTGGLSLDIASGTGQNAVFLSSQGYKVTAVDKSPSAAILANQYSLEKGYEINTVTEDILTFKIEENSFDLIADFYFLEREIIPKIKNGLKKNGLVFFETYTTGQQNIDGPHNPDFLLKTNELISFFTDFFIIFYHERVKNKNAIASLIAQKVD
jgi:SAM-dependent methyltransferase